ncbi:hypothetical protein GCM10010988_17450 [Cnuibacter physcomitrellae]|nr:hypothetical protein GCM10010988_17450 [Cnuibacter physcomitrellae]
MAEISSVHGISQSALYVARARLREDAEAAQAAASLNSTEGVATALAKLVTRAEIIAERAGEAGQDRLRLQALESQRRALVELSKITETLRGFPRTSDSDADAFVLAMRDMLLERPRELTTDLLSRLKTHGASDRLVSAMTEFRDRLPEEGASDD